MHALIIQFLRCVINIPYFHCAQELAGLRTKLSMSATGVFETDFQAQLDHRLEIAIDELRDKSEADIADYKSQMDSAYKEKVQGVWSLPTGAPYALLQRLNLLLLSTVRMSLYRLCF